MADLRAKYRTWLTVALVLLVIGVVVGSFVGCQGASTGTNTLP